MKTKTRYRGFHGECIVPTNKDERRNIMRNIRRETGLPLPLAAKAARAIHSGSTYDIPRDIVEYGGGCGDPGCCGEYPVGVTGPKGSIDFTDARGKVTPKAPKPMPEKVRTIKVKLRNVDAALRALRAAGVAAMIATGECLKRAGRDGADMVSLAINVSGSKAHKILVAAKVTAPASLTMKS